MFTEDFQNYFESACLKSFENALPSTVGPWKVVVTSNDNLKELRKSILITVSSHRFRSLASLHFSELISELGLISGDNKASVSGLSPELQDYLAEMMNTLVGSLKRDLQIQVPSLGMSTPSELDSDCLKYIGALKVDHELTATAALNNTVYFAASFHTSVYGTLELKVAEVIDNQDDGGLEFF